MSSRFLVTAEELQHVAEIVVSFGKIRLDGQRSCITWNRVVEPLQSGQSHAEVKVGIGRISVDLEGAAEQRCGIGKSRLLQPNQTQAINRIEMPIVRLQRDFIEPLGVPQAALRVQDGRLLKRLYGVDIGRMVEWRCSLGHCPPSLDLGSAIPPSRPVSSV